MPCAHKEPSQHFLEYVFVSLHKHPRLLPFGLVRLGVEIGFFLTSLKYF